MHLRLRHVTALAVVAATAFAACSSDDDSSATSSSSVDKTVTSSSSAAETVTDVVAGEPFPSDRCATNEAVGTITFLSSFDFAATASIVDVIVADANGYFEDMCLDVELLPSFSTENYALIAENNAQFSSGGSFSEVVDFAAANDTDFLVTAVEGPIAIDSLIVKPDSAADLEDLEGATIGVKGKLPPSVAAMLGQAGLIEGDDYDTVLVEGYDPAAHIAIGSIAGFPGYKSNEPGALERAGIDFDLFDPVTYDIPGSFGVIYSSKGFVDDNPTVVEDFMRATMMGLADAIADPNAAVAAAVALINQGGNPNFLSEEGERFRWTTDSKLISDLTPDGTGYGVPDAAGLQNELDVYADYGLFGDGDTPNATDYISMVLDQVYDDDDGQVIWPG